MFYLQSICMIFEKFFFLERKEEKRTKNKAYYNDGLYAYVYLFIACHIYMSPK